MAFGFGPGREMMKSVQSNRKQLGKSRSLKENHERFKDVLDTDKPEFKKVSEEELDKFKEEFRRKKQKEDQQNKLILGITFLIVFVIFYIVLF
ncbi:hypothetical protein M0D21_15140 [Aquimarina sp. D1M17]|uniref:hypothetical protein n=1 Tax=Aquimarina acroporae TaxID=2937283 RepID=UPI0020C0F8A0|nr:hypothetical protein [Aquimarina acroporae]MCK8522911.1 hypothetical protein [Aquimarina acroporae]